MEMKSSENESANEILLSCSENFQEGVRLFLLKFKVNTAVPGDISVRPQILELLVKQDDGTFVDMSDCARIEGGTLTIPHEHNFSTNWVSDETTHFHVCSCGERTDVEAHSFSWVVDVEPTETAQGVKHEECSSCGYRRSENTPIDCLPHTHVFSQAWTSDETTHFRVCSCGERTDVREHLFCWIVDVAPTETRSGIQHEECLICGYRHKENTPIAPLPHEHMFLQEWAWDETIHYHACSCGERTDVGEHDFSWIVDVAPTETVQGVKHEECLVCGCRRNENTPIDRLPHKHMFLQEWAWDETIHYHACSCGERTDVGAHDFWWVVDVEPAETQQGVKHEACLICGYRRNENTPIPKTECEHALAYVNAKAATYGEAGNIAYWVCEKCNRCFTDVDAIQEISYLSTLIPPLDIVWGDVNGDGMVDTADAVLILQKAAELIERFPGER